jgi:hypothetical protein
VPTELFSANVVLLFFADVVIIDSKEAFYLYGFASVEPLRPKKSKLTIIFAVYCLANRRQW